MLLNCERSHEEKLPLTITDEVSYIDRGSLLQRKSNLTGFSIEGMQLKQAINENDLKVTYNENNEWNYPQYFWKGL